MYYILVTVFVTILISMNTDCSEGVSHSFPQIVKQPPLNIYAMKDEKIIIPCVVHCFNCTEEIRVRWEKSESKITDTSISASDNRLIIDSYRPNVHNGFYFCIVTYEKCSMRSLQCNVQSAVLPEFSIVSRITREKATAVFKCINHVNNFMEKLEFRWFKDGKLLEPSYDIVQRDEFMFLKNVHSSDAALYSCSYKWKATNTIINSKDVFLNVTSARSTTMPSVTMIAPQKQVEINSSVAVECLADDSPDAVVRIFKLNEKHDMEIKLSENKGFTSLRLSHFQKKDAGKYICETEVAHMRRHKEIEIELIDRPVLDHNGITHINTKTGTQVSFSCNPNSLSDVEITWYHNTVKIKETKYWTFSGLWLKTSNIRMVHSGVYQCVVQNQFGADTKTFYLTVGKSGLAPAKLEILKLAPNKVKLKWLEPRDATNSQIIYKVYWYDSNGRQRNEYSLSTEIEITKGLYGGLKYKFEVCTFYTIKQDVKDCVNTFATMLEAAPLEGPVLNRPVHTTGKIINVSWKMIPPEIAQGIIQNYTIYCQGFFDQNSLHEYHHLSKNTMSTEIHLNSFGTYKVWMVATNNAGKSPISSSYLVSTEERWNSDIDSSEIQFSVRWSFLINKGARLDWTMPNSNDTMTGFRIFYVALPYQNYWKSVSSVTVDRRETTYTIANLPSTKKYRFTMAPVYEWNQNHQERMWLGKRTHNILHRNSNFLPYLQSKANGHDIIDVPSNFICVGTNQHTILLSWDAPKTDYVITDYVVHILNEKTNIESNYSTADRHISIRDLTDVWYAVRVRANNHYLRNLSFFQSGYSSCKTKVNVPSAPRHPEYTFLHHRNPDTRVTYLCVKWKAPLYTGSSIYSYNIRMQEESAGYFKFPFEMNFYHLILDKQHDEWIRSPAIPVKGANLILRVEITANNAAGEGESVKLETEVTGNVPTDKPKYPTPSTTQSSESSPVTLGIVVGLAVSAIFLLIFVVVCIFKDPCKKMNKSQTRSDTYLYLERLKGLETSTSVQSSAATSYSECRVSSKNNKFGSSVYTGYKLINPFRGSAKKKPKHKDGSTVTEQMMLSSSSSCSCHCNSRSHFGGMKRSDLCSDSLYASASSASEEKESPDSIPELCSLKASSRGCSNVKLDATESLLLDPTV